MPFLAIFNVFLPIFSERGVPKNFFGPKNFFSKNLGQSGPRMSNLVLIIFFLELVLIF